VWEKSVFCDIKAFERTAIFESGQLKYFTNLKMHLEILQHLQTILQTIKKSMRNFVALWQLQLGEF